MRGAPAAWPRSRERGQVSIEFLGFLPILLFIALAGVQLGLGAYAAQQAGTAARAAARTASHDTARSSPERAGRAAISDWLADGVRITGEPGAYDEVTYTVRVKIPSLVPFVDFGEAEKSATMPRE